MNTVAEPTSEYLVQPDLVEQILALFAREAGIERSQLHFGARADEFGLGSLDLAYTLFQIEDHFGIRLPDVPVGAPLPTFGELAQHVRQQSPVGAD